MRSIAACRQWPPPPSSARPVWRRSAAASSAGSQPIASGFYGLALMFGFSYGAVMPLYAILVREYFGARIMGTMFGAVNMASTLGMAIGPWAGGWLYDAYGSYFWLYIGSFGIGLGAVAIAFVFRPPREFSLALPSPSLIQGA